MKKISIKDVAKASGVSTATVSNVFSGRKPVNPDLAAKVRRVAGELGYTINKAASLLRSGRNSVVCILVPDLSDPFFTSIITEVEHLAREDGYEIIVGNSDDNYEVEAGRLDAMFAWEPAGAIIIPCTDDLPERLKKEGAPPCVLVDRVANFGHADTVTINNIGAGRQVGEYLSRLGHQNILIAASDMSIHPIRQRAAGVQSAIEGFGGSIRIAEVGSSPERGAKILNEWFEANEPPSAICATTDMTTLAVLRFLADRGIDLPSEMSVVGFDDYAWMSARRTKLTAIRQPVEKIAGAVWRCLMKRISGEAQSVVTTVLDCELITRDSVRELRGQTVYWGDSDVV
jgi:LacI family transcriptional regulator